MTPVLQQYLHCRGIPGPFFPPLLKIGVRTTEHFGATLKALTPEPMVDELKGHLPNRPRTLADQLLQREETSALTTVLKAIADTEVLDYPFHPDLHPQPRIRKRKAAAPTPTPTSPPPVEATAPIPAQEAVPPSPPPTHGATGSKKARTHAAPPAPLSSEDVLRMVGEMRPCGVVEGRQRRHGVHTR